MKRALEARPLPTPRLECRYDVPGHAASEQRGDLPDLALLDGNTALGGDRAPPRRRRLECNRRIRIRRSRVLGEDGRPKTGRSKRDVIIREGLEAVLQTHMPPAGPPMTPSSRRVLRIR